MRTLATLALVLSASTAVAQMPPPPPGVECGPTAEVHDQFAAEYGESVLEAGLSEKGVMLAVQRTPDGLTWTLWVIRPDGLSCIVDHGEAWSGINLTVGDPA